jgi:hypothetical protein
MVSIILAILLVEGEHLSVINVVPPTCIGINNHQVSGFYLQERRRISVKKKLKDLSYKDYTLLLKSGLLWELYPEATGDYYVDTCWK